jgi:hypothetical protein
MYTYIYISLFSYLYYFFFDFLKLTVLGLVVESADEDLVGRGEALVRGVGWGQGGEELVCSVGEEAGQGGIAEVHGAGGRGGGAGVLEGLTTRDGTLGLDLIHAKRGEREDTSMWGWEWACSVWEGRPEEAWGTYPPTV